MTDGFAGDETGEPEPGQPDSVLATTDQPVALKIEEINDERVPQGMSCLGTFLDGNLVARCVVPPGATDYFIRHGVFEEPRQLVLSAREEEPGLRCELYAIVPMPSEELELDEEEDQEPWAASVPGSGYERAVANAEANEGQPMMAAVLLGQIIRFAKDRKHPESLPQETVDVLAKIVSGRVVEVVDRVLDDLLGD